MTRISGKARSPFTYAAATALSGLMPDRRHIASRVPSASPMAVDRNVSLSVNTMPSRNRYPRERPMTSKSNSFMSEPVWWWRRRGR
ncbi:Uncharacterised protein [Bordetella pertussis]|nr:Uncharacterised protein [Bordetella pertussis]